MEWIRRHSMHLAVALGFAILAAIIYGATRDDAEEPSSAPTPIPYPTTQESFTPTADETATPPQ